MSLPLITSDGVELTGVSVGHLAPAPGLDDLDVAGAGPPAEEHHLIWPLDGSTAHVSAGDRATFLLSPDALWVRAGASIRVQGSVPVGSARFRAATCPLAWSRTAHLVLHAGVTALLEWLPAQASRPWAGDVASAVVEQIAHAQLRAPVDLPLPTDPSIRRVALQLLADPSDQRPIGALAADAGYVERTFRRRFAAETGMPFTTWRADLRIRSAMSMLGSGDPVEVVARRCGYSSRAGFTRAFKAAVGLPPSEYARSRTPTVPDLRRVWPPRRDELGEGGDVLPHVPDLSGYSTRAVTLAAAGMLLLATACGDTDDASTPETAASAAANTSEAPVTTAGSDTDEAEATSETTTAAPATTADGGPCETGFRLFDDDNLLGDPVCIPESPERIMPLGFAPIEVMLVTGTDFGVAASSVSTFLGITHPEWVAPYEQATEGLPDIGGFQINIENVAEAAPDLIVATAGFVDPATTELLREIAPMVEFDSSSTGADWRVEYRFAAAAMGITDEVEALIADADVRLEELDAALGDSLDGQTVSVVRARPDDAVQLRLGGSSIGLLLGRLGIERPPSQAEFTNADGLFTEQLSQELWLDEIDADVLFIYAAQPAEVNEELIASITDNPLWGQLGAVQNGRAYAVGASWHSPSVLSEHKVIDDLYEILLGESPLSSELAPVPPEG
ncbi:MAG: AraC family transcriptional regulator [Actinomycetota bacterium]